MFDSLSFRSLKLVLWALVVGIGALLFTFGFLAGRSHGAEIPAVAATSDSYAVAYAEWSKGDKPLLVAYSASWCGPCQQMRSECLPALAAKYTVVHLDIDRDKVLIERYGLPKPASIPCCYVYPPHHRAWRPLWHDQGKPKGPWFFLGLPGFRLLLGK